MSPTGKAEEADDPIPEDAVLLSDAYARLIRVLERISPLPRFPPLFDSAGVPSEYGEPEVESDATRVRRLANVLLREAIENGEIDALINNIDTGQTLKLSSKGWLPYEWVGGLVPSELQSSFVDSTNYELSGPEQQTIISSTRRPVFLRLASFERWLDKQSWSTANPNNVADEALLQAMRADLAMKGSISFREAARKVADRARGASFESKVDRLGKKFRSRWPEFVLESPK